MFSFVHNQDKIDLFRVSSTDFTRRSILDFPTVVSLILHQFKEGVPYNLFLKLSRTGKRVVSASAFTQARAKISYQFFKQLAQIPYDAYMGSRRQLWKGHTLIGIDGSTLNMPPYAELKDHFGELITPRQYHNRVLARFSIAYDVLNHYTFQSTLGLFAESEPSMGLALLDQQPYPDKSIFLFDRGYAARWFVQELMDQHRLFCVRMHDATQFIKDFISGEHQDIITQWVPSTESTRIARARGMEARPFSVRLIKVVLPHGGIEVLATNLLDQAKYSNLGKLYTLRWGVEEGYKKWKGLMRIEMFGSRTLNGILQEIYAHQMMMNLTSILGMEAQAKLEKRSGHYKHRMFYNWAHAFRMVRLHLYDLLTLRKLSSILKDILDQIGRELVAYKAGRNFPRAETGKGRRRRIGTTIKNI